MKSERIKTNCSYCGNELYMTPYIMGKYKNHFCNRDCSTKWKNELMPKGEKWHSYNKIKVICNNCGCEFFKNQSSFKRSVLHFCSKKCFDEGASKLKMRSGSNAGNFKGGNVKFYCSYCGKESEKTLSKFNGESKRSSNHYCSRECFNKWRSENIRGEKCHTFGKKWDNETRKKLSTTRLKIAKYGPDHPSWKGGDEIYPLKFDVLLKRKVRKLYLFTCQCCGKNGYDIHHIDYDKNNCSLDNLIVLCRSCHASTGGNRSFWTSHFKYLKQQDKTA